MIKFRYTNHMINYDYINNAYLIYNNERYYIFICVSAGVLSDNGTEHYLIFKDIQTNKKYEGILDINTDIVTISNSSNNNIYIDMKKYILNKQGQINLFGRKIK